ncbi:MAG TPA: zinc-dependent alcohol dehydrogenase [Ktedonobacterales bacterium]|jgi:threonine dehydrogenase-like Zn-dependent dehydrogenase|nr:zinc-dependent alcohol dehydrogenase [Ktedonobacterales bacterium]
MRALCWHGPHDVRVETVPDPQILNPHDAIVKITSTAICGSDLHLYDGYIPAMLPGDILGHEFMGEVVEVGSEVAQIQMGDRVTVPFPISCGKCFFCQHEKYSLCDNTNPHAALVEKLWGYSPAGIYGYSQLLGGYAGGQAEYARVPFADVGLLKIPEGLRDEQALFLTDILPTGYMAAENCDIHPGDVIAVFGCGPVGQFAIQSARLLGAARIIAIDLEPERLRMAEELGGAETIDASESDVTQLLKQMTGGRGPDAVIDAVGMEAHGFGTFGLYDRVKQSLFLENDRAFVLRQAILACRKGGTLSIAGVYSEFADKIPVGALMNKGLTVRSGQTHVQKYQGKLLERIERGELDPSRIITHTLPLDEAPHGYDIFKHKRDGCVKVVLKP